MCIVFILEALNSLPHREISTFAKQHYLQEAPPTACSRRGVNVAKGGVNLAKKGVRLAVPSLPNIFFSTCTPER